MQNIFSIVFIFFFASSTSFGCRVLEEEREHVFNVMDYGAKGNGQDDDSQSFLKAWEDVCGATGGGIPTLVIPQGKTFMLKPVAFQGPCKSNSIHVQVLGSIVAPGTIGAWSGYEKEHWIQFANVNGLTLDGGGQFDGQGSVWWKCVSGDNFVELGEDCNPPTALHFHKCDNLQLSELKHLNSPKNHISISTCNGAFISNLHIIAPEESPNTDGIDISASSNINIQDSLIETGDDCVAINDGSSYINITGIRCGPGHGISVGSLGEDGAYQTVEEVNVQNCALKGTQNGVRIKTWPGGSGYARKITFDHITLIEAKNPIIIDQDYSNDGDKNNKKKSAVQVSDVTFSHVYGTSANEEAIQLLCSEYAACTNIVMNDVNITSSSGKDTCASSCQNAKGKSIAVWPSVPCLQ